MSFEEHTITASDGIQLYYRDYNSSGKGLPVVCLSGITRNSNDYDSLANHLAGQGRRVIAIDYRGRGKSDWDPNWRNYRPLKLLRDVNFMLHQLHIKHCIVIGTSLGGLLTMGLAALHPGLVSAAVINDIGPDLHADGIPRIVKYIGHRHTVDDWDQAVSTLKIGFPNIGLSSDEDWRMLAEGTYRLGDNGQLHSDWDPAIANTMAGGAKSPLPLWLVYRALHWTPALLIRGGKSDVLSEATYDRMAEVKPDLMRLTIPDAGHTPTLNEPKARAAIDALLAEAGS